MGTSIFLRSSPTQERTIMNDRTSKERVSDARLQELLRNGRECLGNVFVHPYAADAVRCYEELIERRAHQLRSAAPPACIKCGRTEDHHSPEWFCDGFVAPALEIAADPNDAFRWVCPGCTTVNGLEWKACHGCWKWVRLEEKPREAHHFNETCQCADCQIRRAERTGWGK